MPEFLEALEIAVRDAAHAYGRELFENALKKKDFELMEGRDKKKYKHVCLVKTTMQTVMGAVEYRRRYYKDTHTNERVFLLDEFLGLNGRFSPFFQKEIVKVTCEMSFREAAEAISALTGTPVSHQTAWAITQEIGERSCSIDAALAQQTKNEGHGNGRYETKVLFQEFDGEWLRLQRNDRKNNPNGKEMKMGIAYAGIAEANGRSRLAQKVAHAGFEGIREFRGKMEGIIARHYATDEVVCRIINGDGAKWISDSLGPDDIFQLDPFHRDRAIVRGIPFPESRKHALRLLYSKKTDELLNFIKAMSERNPNTKPLADLLQYLTENRNGLTPAYKKKDEQKIPDVNDGLAFAHGGAMESNVFSLIGRRMKRRRACWSIKGANNLASLLCLKNTGRLDAAFPSLITAGYPQEPEKPGRDFTASDVKAMSGKGYEFKHASAPRWLSGIIKHH